MTDYKAYQRWVKTAHERAQFVEVMLSSADMLSEARGGREHKDLWPAEVKKGEKLVNKTVDAVKSFLNPFDVPEEHIRRANFQMAIWRRADTPLLKAQSHQMDMDGTQMMTAL